jgi:hypothetical protein
VLGSLLRDPAAADQRLPCVALLAEHAGEITLLPGPNHTLRVGEQLLFAGVSHATKRMQHSLFDERALHYVVTGEDLPASWIGRWWRRRLQGEPPAA